jgi:hypothetical protein
MSRAQTVGVGSGEDGPLLSLEHIWLALTQALLPKAKSTDKYRVQRIGDTTSQSSNSSTFETIKECISLWVSKLMKFSKKIASILDGIHQHRSWNPPRMNEIHAY